MVPIQSIPRILTPPIHCATSRTLDKSCSSLQLHRSDQGTIPRLRPGSEFTCGVKYKSFLKAGISTAHIEHLKICLQNVIKLLNSFNLGISFVYVDTAQNDTFRLTYGERSNVFATSFFPDAEASERRIILNRLSFDPKYRDSIFNILCHEFGHTLGMRHWNAADVETGLSPVQFPPGSDDRHSIMGIYSHPKDLQFQPQDIIWLKEFYAMKNGSAIDGKRIQDY